MILYSTILYSTILYSETTPFPDAEVEDWFRANFPEEKLQICHSLEDEVSGARALPEGLRRVLRKLGATPTVRGEFESCI